MMPTFEHDSLTITYIDTGDPDGRPFVPQHGIGGDVSQPAGMFASRPAVRLISLDCRSPGLTGPIGDPGTLRFDAAPGPLRTCYVEFHITDSEGGGEETTGREAGIAA